MSERKPPQKPTNLRPYECDLVVNRQHLTKLEISPYYEKHNKEYLEALKKKRIVLSKEELTTKLISDNLIKEFIKQLDKEEEIISEGRYYHWTYYSRRVFKDFETSNKIKAYKLVWCFDDNEPHILGIIDCYRMRKHDRLK